MGKLLDDTDCQILLNTGMSKSYMSKLYYLKGKTLHTLPKFASNMQRIQVGNGKHVGVLFVIPVIIDIHGHGFEVFRLVCYAIVRSDRVNTPLQHKIIISNQSQPSLQWIPLNKHQLATANHRPGKPDMLSQHAKAKSNKLSQHA